MWDADVDGEASALILPVRISCSIVRKHLEAS